MNYSLTSHLSSVTQRMPWPRRFWTVLYTHLKWRFLDRALSDTSMVERFKESGKLPEGYGVAFDERVVEYPWLYAQRPEGRVLDAGSVLNHRNILKSIYPLVDELHIVTLAPEPVAYTNMSINYVYSDLRDLPFRDNYFDSIVSISTLEHVGMDNTIYGDTSKIADDVSQALSDAAAELKRVIKPGGQLFITVPYGLRENHSWLRQFDSADINELVNAFSPTQSHLSIYLYSQNGWQLSSLEAAKNVRYQNSANQKRPESDLAVAARAVACINMIN